MSPEILLRTQAYFSEMGVGTRLLEINEQIDRNAWHQYCDDTKSKHHTVFICYFFFLLPFLLNINKLMEIQRSLLEVTNLTSSI